MRLLRDTGNKSRETRREKDKSKQVYIGELSLQMSTSSFMQPKGNFTFTCICRALLHGDMARLF